MRSCRLRTAPPCERHDHPQFLQQHGVEGDLVDAVQDIACRAWGARALDRVDLHHDRIVRPAFTHERRDGRVTRIAAILVGLAVDLDGLEEGRQSGRGDQDIRAQIVIAEHAAE